RALGSGEPGSTPATVCPRGSHWVRSREGWTLERRSTSQETCPGHEHLPFEAKGAVMRFASDWTQVTIGLGTVAALVVAPAPVSWAQETAPKPAEESAAPAGVGLEQPT